MNKPEKTFDPNNTGAGHPNQKALNQFLDRYLWFMAKRELELREKKLKGKHRETSIKI